MNSVVTDIVIHFKTLFSLTSPSRRFIKYESVEKYRLHFAKHKICNRLLQIIIKKKKSFTKTHKYMHHPFNFIIVKCPFTKKIVIFCEQKE